MKHTEVEPVITTIKNGIHMVTIMNPFTGRAEATHGAFLTYLDASSFLIDEGFTVSPTGLEQDFEDSLAFTKRDEQQSGVVTLYALIEVYPIYGIKKDEHSFNETEEIVELSYGFPFNDEEDIQEHNERFKDFNGFRPLKSFEDHLYENLSDIGHKIETIGEENGWCIGEGVIAKVYLQYDPENK